MKPIVVAGRYRLCHILKEQQPFLLYASSSLVKGRPGHSDTPQLHAQNSTHAGEFRLPTASTSRPPSSGLLTSSATVHKAVTVDTHTLKIGECGSDLIEHKKYFYFLLEERCASFLDIFEQLDRQFT